MTAAETALVDELLEQFRLADLADRNIRTLSYGQLRRVLIARAVVHEPRVLLLDEPWEGLDRENRKLVNRELEQIVTRGTQLVSASHLSDTPRTVQPAAGVDGRQGRRVGRVARAGAGFI